MKNAIIAATFSLLLASPSLAKTEWATTGLDPTKAYVLVQVEPLPVRMFGSDGEIVTTIMLSPYDTEKSGIRSTETKGKGQTVDRVYFVKTEIAKGDKRRQYFNAIAPGTWVIEGAGGNGGKLGAAMTSFALGSHRFEARAGEVIDLGVIVPSREESDNPDTKMTTGKLAGMMFGGPFGGGRIEPLPLKIAIRPRSESDLALPAWLSNAKIVQPGFVYGATFSNLLGGLVNRVDGKAGRGRKFGEVVYLSKLGQPKEEAAAPSLEIQPIIGTPMEPAAEVKQP